MSPHRAHTRLTLGFAAAAVALLVSISLAAHGARPAGVPDPDPFQRGMVFGLFAREDPEHTHRALREMKALGVDSICIVVPWVTPDVESTTMAPRGDMTPSDGALTYAIRHAHQQGLRVFLMPILYVDRIEEGEWRGTMRPADWKEWFARYAEFILHYARISAAEKVEYLSVGSELCSSESRTQDWVDLIGRVRAVYPGRVTYSANWDHRHAIRFTGELDWLGMNAYFKLTDEPLPDEEALVRAWAPIKAEIQEWLRSTGRRLVITEVGYPSRAGAGSDPWNYSASGAPDPELQRRLYRAFQRAWGGERLLDGVYFYMWWGEGGPADTGYTPKGKPAEGVIRDWYVK